MIKSNQLDPILSDKIITAGKELGDSLISGITENSHSEFEMDVNANVLLTAACRILGVLAFFHGGHESIDESMAGFSRNIREEFAQTTEEYKKDNGGSLSTPKKNQGANDELH